MWCVWGCRTGGLSPPAVPTWASAVTSVSLSSLLCSGGSDRVSLFWCEASRWQGLGTGLAPWPAFLSVGSKCREFWAPSLQVWHPAARVQRMEGAPIPPPPFHPSSSPPLPPSARVSTYRKWATCFHNVIPSPVWAAELIRIYRPVKGKERALSLEAFPGVEDERDFLHHFLGNLLRCVTDSPWWPWATGSWSPPGYITSAQTEGSRTPDTASVWDSQTLDPCDSRGAERTSAEKELYSCMLSLAPLDFVFSHSFTALYEQVPFFSLAWASEFEWKSLRFFSCMFHCRPSIFHGQVS